MKTPQRHCFQTVFVPPQMSQTFEYEVGVVAGRDEQALMMMAQEPPDSPRYKQIPQWYHSMKCVIVTTMRSRVLDGQGTELVTGSLGYLSSVYKVVDSADGYCYALRRVERVRTNNEIVVGEARACEAQAMTKERWSKLVHPSVVSLHDCYLSNGAVFFVHAYYPSAISLASRYLSVGVGG